jgi:hypothetical protein
MKAARMTTTPTPAPFTDDVLYAYVSAENRNATWSQKVQKMATLIADTAARDERAIATITAFQKKRSAHAQ